MLPSILYFHFCPFPFFYLVKSLKIWMKKRRKSVELRTWKNTTFWLPLLLKLKKNKWKAFSTSENSDFSTKRMFQESTNTRNTSRSIFVFFFVFYADVAMLHWLKQLWSSTAIGNQGMEGENEGKTHPRTEKVHRNIYLF